MICVRACTCARGGEREKGQDGLSVSVAYLMLLSCYPHVIYYKSILNVISVRQVPTKYSMTVNVMDARAHGTHTHTHVRENVTLGWAALPSATTRLVTN